MFADHPILERLQLRGVVQRVGARERVEIDLANRAEIGAQLRIQVRRQIDLLQFFQHLLAAEQIIRLLVENQRDR